jgi:hypothetical protein
MIPLVRARERALERATIALGALGERGHFGLDRAKRFELRGRGRGARVLCERGARKREQRARDEQRDRETMSSGHREDLPTRALSGCPPSV